MPRKKRIEDCFFVAGQYAIPEVHGPPGLSAQLVELIEHLLLCIVERALQSRIEPGERLANTFQEGHEFLLVRRHFPGQAGWNILSLHCCSKVLGAEQDISKFEGIPLQEALNRGFNDGEARAREDDRRALEQPLVEHAILSEISNLCRAGNVSSRRE